jgi:hypothetical protein
MAQLGKAALTHKAGPTLTAAQRAAEDPNAKTPAAILFEKYWTPEPVNTHDTGLRHCIECFRLVSVNELTRTGHGWECGCKSDPNFNAGTAHELRTIITGATK